MQALQRYLPQARLPAKLIATSASPESTHPDPNTFRGSWESRWHASLLQPSTQHPPPSSPSLCDIGPWGFKDKQPTAARRVCRRGPGRLGQVGAQRRWQASLGPGLGRGAPGYAPGAASCAPSQGGQVAGGNGDAVYGNAVFTSTACAARRVHVVLA